MSNQLPEIITKIIDLIGEPATYALVQAYGGIEINLPLHKNCRESHELVPIIGLDNLKKLTRHFALGAKQNYYIPMCSAILLHKRNTKIVQDYDAGIASTKQLARQNRTSERNIKRILKQTDASATPLNAPQMGLF